MKYLIYHVTTPLGFSADIMTDAGKKEPTYADLVIDEEMRIMEMEKAGFKVLKDVPNVVPAPQSVPQATTQSQEHHCATCGNLMIYKEGISAKTGKPWKGWFCSEKGHEVQWLK